LADSLAPVSPALRAYANLVDSVADTPEYKGKNSKLVLGKRVRPTDAKRLASEAAGVLAEHFGIWEVVRLIHDPRFGLERYMDTLANIRDDPGATAKDRILAADKIVSTILGTIANAAPRELNATDAQQQEAANRSRPNLTNVLVQVQGTGTVDPSIGPRRDANLLPRIEVHQGEPTCDPSPEPETHDSGLPLEPYVPPVGEQDVPLGRTQRN
jgi:hypothetical protein